MKQPDEIVRDIRAIKRLVESINLEMRRQRIAREAALGDIIFRYEGPAKVLQGADWILLDRLSESIGLSVFGDPGVDHYSVIIIVKPLSGGEAE